MSNNRTAFFFSALRELKADCAAFLTEIREDRTLGYETRLILTSAVHDFMRRRIRELLNQLEA